MKKNLSESVEKKVAEYYGWSNYTADDIYVVWLVKVLQNNKALLSTTMPDGMYFEVTYNGDKQEFYLDAYKRIDNRISRLTD